jgi:hypothetical protein
MGCRETSHQHDLVGLGKRLAQGVGYRDPKDGARLEHPRTILFLLQLGILLDLWGSTASLDAESDESCRFGVDGR